MEIITKTRSLAHEELIESTKQFFEVELKKRLNLTKVNAPLFVSKNSGLNDDLNGVEKAVSFDLNGVEHEIVHSLAKWKRWYVGELGVEAGKGIVTDMKAIRADEELSPIHSYLVDQWDWEKVINKEDRTVSNLIKHGKAVFEALRETERIISEKSGSTPTLPLTIEVVYTEDLYQKYPDLTPKEREHAITREYGAVLLVGIGGKLSNGEVHDLRAPDYDDWSTKGEHGYLGLNADIIVWDEVRAASLELSSMGIRVDEKALKKQLAERGASHREEFPFHRALLNSELPYTIGGGIGQSRVAMFITKEKEISAVQSIFA